MSEEQTQEISRSARKRAAKDVEQLAHDLAEVAPAQLPLLPISAELADALELVRQTRGHGSRKRQLKFFAGLLRKDPDQCEELRAFLSGEHQNQRDENRRTHQLEQLRERLCDSAQRSAALREAQELLPQLDPFALEKMLNGYRGSADKRTYRQVFRLLRAASEAEEAGEA
ncbi:MAG: hypothetical protein C0620_04185 [Desulfuromonas sp.]|nr:MAG: hypothetical protein C0620_04185 [Desulfuromonas sp.]